MIALGSSGSVPLPARAAREFACLASQNKASSFFAGGRRNW
jgi:hypothetical protein